MSETFIPATPDFVKKHAKQLKAAFPGLPLTKAQEATARALGFTSLFDCMARLSGTRLPRSEPDEAIPISSKLQRRHTQIRSLVDFAGLPAHDVGEFVRRWKLTADAPSTLSRFCTVYAEMDVNIRAIESGKMTLDQAHEFYDFHDSGNIPRRVGDGIVHGPYGHKYEYLALNLHMLLSVPVYMRGNASIFLDFEDGGAAVVLTFPECFEQHKEFSTTNALQYLAEHNSWIYEWHTGRPAPDFHGITLSEMLTAARERPDDWYALSCRYIAGDTPSELRYAIPALKGADFVRFIENQGSLLGLDLKWFSPTDDGVVYDLVELRYGNFIQDERRRANRLDPQRIRQCEPFYDSPFKHGPMHGHEFDTLIEGGGMRLSDEIEDDDDLPASPGRS